METSEGYNVYSYEEVYSIKAYGKTYYLAVKSGKFSSRDIREGIKSFSLDDGQLNDTVKIFKTGGGLQNEITFGFDLFRSERTQKLITYDARNRIISFPVVYGDSVTKKSIRYQFTGRYFEKVQAGKKGASGSR